MSLLLSELQRDALQELMNISMGQAANALARLIDAKITLSIPKIVVAGDFAHGIEKRTLSEVSFGF